jgi:predicted RNase H-like HicB family nuclease
MVARRLFEKVPTGKYAVVIERGDASYGAYVPDLPGCIAVGDSQLKVQRLIAEAISLRIESLIEHGDPVPEPQFRGGLHRTGPYILTSPISPFYTSIPLHKNLF